MVIVFEFWWFYYDINVKFLQFDNFGTEEYIGKDHKLKWMVLDQAILFSVAVYIIESVWIFICHYILTFFIKKDTLLLYP